MVLSGGPLRRGFTLIELLVVLLIILMVSVVALPTVVSALGHRQVSEAGRILQGAIVGARDQAIHDGQPSGIRLLPDPTFVAYQGPTLPNGQPNPQAGWVDLTRPLAYNRVIPIGPAPEYTEGRCTVRHVAATYYPPRVTNPSGAAVRCPSLILEAAPVDARGAPNPPTDWAWNIRVGDRVQLNGAGPWYTVVGPMWVANPEGFINWGKTGVNSPIGVEWLILVDGRDDDANGWTDEGFDGVDNDGDPRSPGYGVIDDPGEWESEVWQGSLVNAPAVGVPYAVRRRSAPRHGAREVALPTQMVIDAARSRLPINPLDGYVDILISPDGTAQPSIPYGVPASLGMGSAFFHFGLASREDIGTGQPPTKGWSMLTLQARTGRTVVVDEPDPANPFLAGQQDAR